MFVLGSNTPNFPICDRCKKEITLAPGHCEDGLWYHHACHEAALNELARAIELAKRFGFADTPPPFATLTPRDVFKKRYDPERTYRTDPQFFGKPYASN